MTSGEPKAQRIVFVTSADATVQGGPATPIVVLPAGSPTSAAPVLRVVLVSGRAVQGGPSLPVVVVETDATIGGPVLPVVIR